MIAVNEQDVELMSIQSLFFYAVKLALLTPINARMRLEVQLSRKMRAECAAKTSAAALSIKKKKRKVNAQKQCVSTPWLNFIYSALFLTM